MPNGASEGDHGAAHESTQAYSENLCCYQAANINAMHHTAGHIKIVSIYQEHKPDEGLNQFWITISCNDYCFSND